MLQYLHFLIDVSDDLARTWLQRPGGKKANLDNTKIDAKIFSKLCEDLKTKIVEALNEPGFSQVDYLDIILDFDDQVRIEKRFVFSSIKVYDTFFDNYDMFHENPLGFVRVSYDDNNRPTYVATGQTNNIKPIDGRKLPLLLTDALRCYPVINVDGNTVLVYYSKHGHFGMQEFHFLEDYHKDPNDGFAREAYTNLASPHKTYYYGVNYDHLDINGGMMVGVPFLSKLPFDNIVSALDRDDA